MNDPIRTVLDYHERTKHHPRGFALGPGGLDWDTQPDPFRRYQGSPIVPLPIPRMDETPRYEDIFPAGTLPPKPVSLETLSGFLYYSMAVSAWKEAGGNRWALRVNPSSGNLHPTECYILSESAGGGPSLCHYAPKEHALEVRNEIRPVDWERLTANLPAGSFLVGLSSIHWREAWKYGERAYRYCQHDAGHAIAALRISAALLGWRMTVLESVDDPAVAHLLGLDRSDASHPEEEEVPDLIAAVSPMAEPAPTGSVLPEKTVASIAAGTWLGKANLLSRGHVHWEAIEIVSAAARKEGPGMSGAVRYGEPARESGEGTRTGPSAGSIIRGRRSAVDYDGETSIGNAAFNKILNRTIPNPRFIPWDAAAWPPRLHLGIFVHRVTGLDAGLYVLVRDPEDLGLLKEQMNPKFLWERPADCPKDLPLYLLERGDYRSRAAMASCGQDIAGDGAFSLGMLSVFEPSLRGRGASFYRNLHWEAGMIGQVLYLEAEAAGGRGTGIGCYFDDSVHGLFGLEGRTIQSLYHFTVGGPVDDSRLTTLPAY